MKRLIRLKPSHRMVNLPESEVDWVQQTPIDFQEIYPKVLDYIQTD